MKIVILGNSVGLRVRPPTSQGFTYFEHLRDYFNAFEVINKCYGRATSREIYTERDKYINEFADIYIINLGCVDAPSREIPLWYSDIRYGRRKTVFSGILNVLYNKLIQPNRRLCVSLRNKTSWISRNEFKKNISSFIDTIHKDTRAQVIVLGINKGTQRIEDVLPGTLEKYNSYNGLLRSITKEKEVVFLDPNDYMGENEFPDGVHYNQEGHKIISQEIIKLIEKSSIAS